jgi:hypothetical protein
MSDSGQRDCAHDIEYSRIRDMHVSYLIFVVKYSDTSKTSRYRRKIPKQYSGKTPKPVSS